MKRKPCIATVSGFVIASLVLVAGPVNAEYTYSRGQSKAVYDYARVISAYPVVRHVTVTTPVQECWDDVEHYSVQDYAPDQFGQALFGAIIGGVIGHQIGSGSGNDAATIAGSLIGAAIGSEAGRPDELLSSSEYSQPVRRCSTNYQEHQEERIEGYDVVYTYHGRTYSTRTPFDPGKKLKISVDVRPAA